MTLNEEFEIVWSRVNKSGLWNESQKKMAQVVYSQGVANSLNECIEIIQKVSQNKTFDDESNDYYGGYVDACDDVALRLLDNMKGIE